MPSSSPSRRYAAWAAGAALALVAMWARRAEAQQQPQGFAVERLYPSAPGGGWFVMDALDMRGGLGGAATLTVGYAHDPLVVATTDGASRAHVVRDQAFADLGFAATYDRFRLYMNLTSPLVINGETATLGDYAFTGPAVDVGRSPDLISDARIGFDARIVGGPRCPFRLGAGAQLFIPNGNRYDYDTDGTFRAMARVLVAGDVGALSYAGHLGVHVRPLDDSPTPGSPRGSELLFGVAAGPKLPVGKSGAVVAAFGPEIFGATAFQSFFGTTATGLEALLTGRLEGTADDGAQLRVKLGAGAGMNAHLGAPEWRVVFGIEVFDHGTDRDKDGVTDSHDACPDVPGVKTKDPKTNGCPAAPR